MIITKWVKEKKTIKRIQYISEKYTASIYPFKSNTLSHGISSKFK